MIRKKTLAFALAVAFAIGGAGVLYAQAEQDDIGMMGMMGMMQDCPMIMGMAEGPAAALRHAEALDLTPDQVERLESLRQETREARRAAMERMRPIHEEIAAATGDTFDEAAVRAAFARMGDLHEEIGVAMLCARHQTSGLLTPEQREALAGFRSGPMNMMGSMEGMEGLRGMKGMPGMGMMEMMIDCPMMRGGMGDGAGEERGNMRHQEEEGR